MQIDSAAELQGILFKFPEKAKVQCTGTVCCYPSDAKTMFCVSSQNNWGTVLIYIKVIEK